MTTKKHTDSPTGPLANIASVYCTQLDARLKASEPLLRSVTRQQLEWARLATQRTRAWMALPTEVAQCKTPADMFSLNMRFWQTAAVNYSEATQRMWAAAQPGLVAKPAHAGGHDYLEVPDTKSGKAAASTRQAA